MESQKLKAKSQLKVKVCGLTQLSQIRAIISMNIDFIGFIFYEKSPRFALNHLSLSDILEVKHSGKVGVFVNESIEEIVEISEKANLNFIQLHGNENEEFILKLRKSLSDNVKIIKVIRIGNQTSEDLQIILNQQPPTLNYLLFDTDSQVFGGTGKAFDWNVLNEIEIPIPYFLSGGISLENIHQLKMINNQPTVLDINSKFEITPGIKDLKKVKEFFSVIK